MLRYMRKLITENRKLLRQNADLTGALLETTAALNRSVARNLELSDELRKSTAMLRLMTNASYGKSRYPGELTN